MFTFAITYFCLCLLSRVTAPLITLLILNGKFIFVLWTTSKERVSHKTSACSVSFPTRNGKRILVDACDELLSAHCGHNVSRDSSVGIALCYGLDDWGSRVRFLARARNFSLHHHSQNGSGAHPASYPVGTSGSFPGGKAAVAWSWPLTFIYNLHSPNMPSWCGA
jgi:hypothetical protein